MADTTMNGAVPKRLVLHPKQMQNVEFTLRELETIKAELGQSLSALMSEGSDLMIPVVGWLILRRQGHDVSFEQMRDIIVTVDEEATAEFVAAQQQDPTNEPPVSGSPDSVVSGA